MSAFITANIIQGAVTLLVGLLYGAMLPMWPKRPILLGGIIAPVIWTGCCTARWASSIRSCADASTGGRFAASQVIFGLVAGYTVMKLGHIERLQQVPLPVRLGVERRACSRGRARTGAEAMSAGCMLRLACCRCWLLLLSGCDLPGRPQPGREVPRPEAVMSFDMLYATELRGMPRRERRQRSGDESRESRVSGAGR